MVGKELYLFFHHLVRRHPGGPWDFLPLETEILRIGNPNVPPPDWTLERGSLPWRGEALLLGGSPQIVGGHLWAFATRPTGTHRELVAARISLEDVRAFRMDRWAFLMKDGTLPRWTARPEKALGLFQGVGTEFTVAQDVTGNGWLCLYSPGGISPEIHLRWAPRLGGPWGPPTVLYRCPEEERDPEVFCYGAKLHPECAAGDLKGLWITYTVNTRHGNPPPAGQSRPRWVWIPIPFSD